MDDLLKPDAPSRPGLSNVLLKPLDEDPPLTILTAAPETPDLEANLNRTTVGWKIGQAPLIVAMDLSRGSPAQRADRNA